MATSKIPQPQHGVQVYKAPSVEKCREALRRNNIFPSVCFTELLQQLLLQAKFQQGETMKGEEHKSKVKKGHMRASSVTQT